jgi:uncharacterized protein YdeI (YjbR/CyaY-like superfamily)
MRLMKDTRAELPILSFPDADALGGWLDAHGDTAPGIWMKLSKSSAPARTISKTDAIDVALCHGWIDGQLDRYDEHYWLVRFTPRKARGRWSRVNRDRALKLIAEGRMRPTGALQIEAAKADGRWSEAYAPASSAEVPQDLLDALADNPKAAAFFSTLKGANRYAILYRIGSVKKAETRSHKVAQFVGMLERGETVHG